MKKFLTFLALVCFMVMGAWAQTTVELTTDVNNPHLYQIASYNRGGVLTSNGAGQGVTHVDMGNGGYWYFTAAEGNTTGTVAGGVIMHNMDGTQLKNNWTTAATGDVIYILPNGVNDNGISICKNSAIQGSDCMDANNYNTGVGTWGPSTSDWEGTTWVISATEMNLDTYRANAKTTIDGYYLASESLKTTHKGNVDEATIPAAVDAAVTAAFAAYQTEVAGKVWHVQSGYPEYYNKQGVYKSLKYNGTTIGWGNFSNEDTQCYMYLEITTGGKLYVKTTDGKYMQGVDGSLGATPGTNSAATLKKYDDGTFNMIFGNGTAHTNNHGNGSGVSGNLVNWGGEGGSASSWKFIEGDAEKLASLLFGEALKNAINEAADAYAVNDVPTTATDIDVNLITANNQFSSNASQADEGSLDNLLDNDLTTYWHSSWASAVAPHVHYLQVTLAEAIEGPIQMTMGRRQDTANDHPVKMSVEYSADGTNYTLLPGYMYFTATTGYVSGTFHMPASAKYLRFFNEESNGTNQRGYWHCSEFQLNKVTNSRNIEHTTEAAALQSAIATATAAFNSGSYTQATIDALLAAIETYKNAVDAAPATITYEYKIGDEIVDTEVIESVVGAEYPAPKTFEFYTQSAKPIGTISESGTYTINLTWDGPFEFTTINGSDFAEGTKWYYMQNGNNNGNGYVVYGNGEDKRSSMTTTAGTDDTYKWCFVRKTGSTAFYLYNKAADAIALHEELSSDAQHPEWATNHNQGFCVAKTDGVNDMPLILRANNNGYSLQLAGEGITGTCLLGKHVNSYLSIWGNSANVTNDGCRFTFEEALDLPEKTYVFYLTDADGNTYEGTFTSAEEHPHPACVEGFALSNENWEDVSEISDDVDYVYTADFEFPFPVNTPTAISGFAGYNAPFWWRAAGNDIVVKAGDEAVGNDYAWIITPAFADNTFTYTFQSVKTEKYVKVNATGSNHDQGAVTLDEKANATLFTYTSESFQAVGQTLYLSVKSSTTSDEQYVGVNNTIHNGSRMYFGDVTPVSIDITIGETGYATIAYAEDFVKPEGLKVYYCKDEGEAGHLTPVEWTKDYIPGMAPYILEGTPNTTYTFNEVANDFVIPTEDYAAVFDIFDGALFGNYSDEAMTVDEAKADFGDNIYVFSKKNDKMGFYAYAGTTLAAHKAFYATHSSLVSGFTLDFGGQTVGVSSVISATNLKAGYDIQGRRINKVQKGINILNGKKIIK